MGICTFILGYIIAATVAASSYNIRALYPVGGRPVRYLLPSVLYRFPRQVVQPTWLNNNEAPASTAADVRVTPENLQEAAAIREDIKKAVELGQYFVNVTVDETYEPPPADEPKVATRKVAWWPQWRNQAIPFTGFAAWPTPQQFHQNLLQFLGQSRRIFGIGG